MDHNRETNELRSSCRGKFHNAFTTTKPTIIGGLLQWQENLLFQEVFIFYFCFVKFDYFFWSLFIVLFIKINLGGLLGFLLLRGFQCFDFLNNSLFVSFQIPSSISDALVFIVLTCTL
jgi:hypothetical protein